jgi:hypothetical protein
VGAAPPEGGTRTGAACRIFPTRRISLFSLHFLQALLILENLRYYRIGQVFMKGRAARGWLRLIAGGALALFAVGFLSPARAHASCGDYVSFGSDQGSHPSHNSPNVPSGNSIPQRPGQKPCHGPYCDGSQTPAPQPPTTAPVRVQDWACLSKLRLVGPTDSSSLCSGGENQDRIHHTHPIYHPPRPSNPGSAGK